MYFFAAWPALWLTVSYATNRLFAFVEWWFYREALFYLDSVRRTARGLIFMCLVGTDMGFCPAGVAGLGCSGWSVLLTILAEREQAGLSSANLVCVL